MKKDIMQKFFFCILCAACIIVADFVGIRFLSAKQLDLIEVPVASHDINPRAEIKEEDYTMAVVSGFYIMDNAYRSSTDIIGKYTDLQGKIPKGSPFYKSMLFEAEALPDHPVLELKDGEAVYTASGSNTDFAVLTPGLRVDVHLSCTSSNNVPVTGVLIEHARILTIKDHQGIDVSSPKSSGIAYMIDIAVQKNDLDLLTLAEASGQLRFFASSDSYQDEEAALCSDSAAVQYLMQQKIEKVEEN